MPASGRRPLSDDLSDDQSRRAGEGPDEHRHGHPRRPRSRRPARPTFGRVRHPPAARRVLEGRGLAPSAPADARLPLRGRLHPDPVPADHLVLAALTQPAAPRGREVRGSAQLPRHLRRLHVPQRGAELDPVHPGLRGRLVAARPRARPAAGPEVRRAAASSAHCSSRRSSSCRWPVRCSGRSRCSTPRTAWSTG